MAQHVLQPYTLKRAIPVPPELVARRAPCQEPHVVREGRNVEAIRQCYGRPRWSQATFSDSYMLPCPLSLREMEL
jgi:hypothetical protein